MTSSKETVSAIGSFVVDEMKELEIRLSGLSGAILTSADGFNICSLGIDSAEVGKGASLVSTMFSLTSAITDTISSTPDDHPSETGQQEVLISCANMQIAMLQITHPTLDNLVLLVAAEDTMAGLLLATARLVVDRIEKKLATLVGQQPVQSGG